MKQIKILAIAILLISTIFSCSENKTAPNRTTNAPQASGDSSVNNTNQPSEAANDNAFGQIDTTKMKQNLNNIISGAINGKPDTNLLKKTAADVLTTDANILSDSGISKLYGNSNDPSVNTAKNTLIKMRNSMGLTPDKLDSMKKSAALLNVATKNN